MQRAELPAWAQDCSAALMAEKGTVITTLQYRRLLAVSAAYGNTWEQRKAGEGVSPLVPIKVSANGVILCSS